MSGGQSLHAAASGGDVARVRSILTTPRSYTAGFQSLLLSRAASTSRAGGAASAIDELDSSGCTALQRAAAEGHEEICRLLLAHGADVNRKDTLHGNTALHEAAWKGYSRTVGLLAAAGANLGPPNNGGFAPLHLCCQNGHNQSCRELLLANCDPDLQNNYGDTPLHTSARYGHAGVTRILISAQCRVSDQNKNGDTALHIAAAMGRRKLTRILLEAGCDKHLRNKQSETAKDIATRKDLNEIIHILNSTKPLKRSKHCDIIPSDKKRTKECTKDKHKKKSKVRFEPTGKHWSPYGCHYFPDPKSFPKPKLNSLPHEPLRKGEQYYLDLAGNICKGPIGVGYTCYCAPFFKHMEERLDRDKQELKAHIDKAHERLDHKVSNLERKTQGQISELTRCVQAERALCDKRHQHLEEWLMRNRFGRQSERVRREPVEEVLTRSRSLELLDELTSDIPRNSKSMDLLDEEPLMNFEFKSQVLKETAKGLHKVQVDYHASDDPPRKTVSEIIAEIQNKEPVKRTELNIPIYEQDNEDSESSDEECEKTKIENLNFSPRMRSVLYTPSEEFPHIHVPPKLPYETGLYVLDNTQLNGFTPEGEPNGYVPYRKPIDLHLLEKDVHNRIANLHLGGREAKVNLIEHNDSGYSTKVYGSSQGNSPSLSGEVENINNGKVVASQNRTINNNIGASSLV